MGWGHESMGQEHGAILSIFPHEVRLDLKKIYCIRFFTNLLSLSLCPLILRNFLYLKNHLLLSFDACCFLFLKKKKNLIILFWLEDNYFEILWGFLGHTSTWIIHGCTCVLQDWTLHSPPSLPHSSELSQNTDFEGPTLCIELALVICFTYGNIYVSMIFSQIIPPSPTPKSPKVYSLYLSLFCCLAYRNAITIFLNPICCCCC